MTSHRCYPRRSGRCAPPAATMLEAYEVVFGLTWHCRCGKVWELRPDRCAERLVWTLVARTATVASSNRRTGRRAFGAA